MRYYREADASDTVEDDRFTVVHVQVGDQHAESSHCVCRWQGEHRCGEDPHKTIHSRLHVQSFCLTQRTFTLLKRPQHHLNNRHKCEAKLGQKCPLYHLNFTCHYYKRKGTKRNYIPGCIQPHDLESA